MSQSSLRIPALDRGAKRPALVRAVATALDRLGCLRALSLAAGHVRRRPAFPILTYHRVNDDADPFFPSVPTRLFERQMAFVARTYRVMAVDALVDHMRCGSVPRNALAITFDDGYRDNLTHAAPILSRYRLPATIFLATGFIGTGTIPWFDRLALAFKRTRAETATAPWADPLFLPTVAARLETLERVVTDLKRRPDEEVQRRVDVLERELDVTDQRAFEDLMLSWDDVHTLGRLGFSIGAHTVNHPILSRISLGRVWREIDGSRSAIEAAGGRPPRAFAYPNGGADDYTGAIARLVRDAGFTCAVTTRFGVNTAATSPWELRRGGPWEAHVPSFALKLAHYRLVYR